jgi:putative phosphoesterase
MLVPRPTLGKRNRDPLHSSVMSGRAPGPRAAVPGAVVGLISDTHGLVRPEALVALTGVDLIVHAGDIGGPAVLEALRAIAPVVAVRGNNDREAWAASLPEIARTEIEGARLCVVHDLKELRLDPTRDDIDVVVHGHSHRPSVEHRERVLIVNPGSAGPRRFTLPIAVARLRLTPEGPCAEIVALDLTPVRGRPQSP